MAKRCTAKNAAGKACKMAPLRGTERCWAHSRKSKAQAAAARKKGGRRRAKQQQRAAVARSEEAERWRELQTVADVDAAIVKVTLATYDGDIGAKEAAALAKLLMLARDAAERRERDELRRSTRNAKGAPVGAAKALDEAVSALLEMIRQAKADRGIPPEVAREQIIRAAAALTKAADPARIIAELTDELRATVAALERKQESDALPEPAGDRREGEGPPH